MEDIQQLKKDIKHLTNVLQVAKMQMERGAYDAAQDTVNEGVYYACLLLPEENPELSFLASEGVNVLP